MKNKVKKIILYTLALISVLILAIIFACVSTPPKDKEPAVIEKTPEPADTQEQIVLEYDPYRLIFLLIGQSNMEGNPKAEPQDKEENPRILVLAYRNSPAQKRRYNQWAIASPPLHSPFMGLGPGDYFAKTLIAGLPEKYSIGLVPCGLNGVDIDFFRKNIISKRRKEFRIPPDNKWDGAYDWVIERAKLAQKSGVIAGILIHQGESDAGQSIWLDKINEIVTDLRTDLNLGEVPVLVGELLYKGPCSGHNRVIKNIPDQVSNAYVISAEGLNGTDQFHFDLEGQRELGKRYGQKMLEVLKLPE